ncbi:MAG TPA: tRNA pseudouridine(55) synthase TruB [Gemmatimonadaceae bacterium]
MRPTRRAARPKGPTTAAEGLLLVDKPAGVSSHDVVAVARRTLGEKRIGHAGTLDPFATGLLVLLLGRATRLIQYLPDEPKVYEAVVRFGQETDTEDAGGVVVREAPLPTAAALEAARERLVGTIAQVPPAYSAKHVDGKRAYQLARRGVDLVLAPVDVTVNALELSGFETTDAGTVSRCRMRVECGGGMYVRSLARDLARAAGSAAHLETLRRHRAGVFTLARAIPYERLRDGTPPVSIAPSIDALEGLPLQPLDGGEVAAVTRGIDIEARVAGAYAALVEAGGHGALVAFAERVETTSGDRWQPRVVMRDA